MVSLFRSFPALCGLMLVLSACATRETIAPAVPTTLTVTALAPTVLVGGSTSVRATVLANNKSVSASGVVWSSSAPSIATVSADGTITGVARGTTQIRGTVGAVSGSVGIEVLGVRALAVQAPRASLYVSQTMMLTAQLDVDPGVSPTVSWSSSNPAVATVTGTGVVSAVGLGTVTISASLLGQSAGITLTVVPVPIASLAVTPSSATLLPGGTQQMTASARDSAGTVLTGRPVTWSTSAPTVSTVSATGLVTAVGPGTATIIATSEGKTAAATITVLPPVATITVTVPTLSIAAQQTVQATALLRDAGGNVLSGRTVTWSSSNPTVASITADGQVTGVATGTATITATSEGRSGSATLTVVPPISAVMVTPAVSGLAIGRTRTVSASVLNGSGVAVTDVPVIWQSSNAAVATVSASGVVTAQAAGEVTITATARGVTGTSTLYVGRNYTGQNLAGITTLREGDHRGASFVSANLASADMYRADFSYADFTNASLPAAIAWHADFTGAILAGTTWDGAFVNGSTKWPSGFDPRGRGIWGPDQDYSGQDLSAKRFRWNDFTRSKFIGARLVGTELLNVLLLGADLTNASLNFADLRSANLNGANLTGTTWTEALFDSFTQWPSGFSPLGRGMFGPRENYAGRNFAGRSFFNLDFSYADFSGANLTGCAMNIAALVGTKFTGATLAAVNFDGSDLRDAAFNGAVLTGASFTNARLAGATYNSATLWPTGFDPVAAGAIRQ